MMNDLKKLLIDFSLYLNGKFKSVLRSFLIILILLVTVFLVFSPYDYNANLSILVIENIDENNAYDNVNLAWLATYQDIINQELFIEKVIKDDDQDAVSDFKEKVSMTTQGNSLIFNLHYIDNEAEGATSMVESVYEELKEELLILPQIIDVKEFSAIQVDKQKQPLPIGSLLLSSLLITLIGFGYSFNREKVKNI